MVQSDELEPSEEMEVRGIPKIPKSIIKDINKYTISFGWPLVDWNIDGSELITKSKAGGFSLYASSVPIRIPRVIVNHREKAIYDIYPDPHYRYLIFNKDTDGDEIFQMYLFNISNKSKTLISDGTSRDTEPIWSNSGKQIVFSCSPNGTLGVNLCLIDPFKPKSRRQLIKTRGYYFVAQDWSPDNRYIVYCEFYSNTLSRIWLKDLKTGSNTPLTPHFKASPAYYDLVEFSKDGKGLYFITDKDSEYRRLAYLDLKTRKIRYLVSHINWDVEAISEAPDGTYIAFIVNENGISRLYTLNVMTGKVKKYDTKGDGIINNVRWKPGATTIAFNFNSHSTPGDLRVLDISTGDVIVWLKGFTGNLKVNEWQPPELISWTSFDGLKITGYMYQPPSTFPGKRPVIIDIHGGPEEQFRPIFGHIDNYFINQLGIVKIYPNIRGSTGYGKSFLGLDDGTLRHNTLNDIGALLDWIGSKTELDSERVFLQGASYGGYISLSAAIKYSTRIKGAIIESAPIDIESFMKNTKGWRRTLRRLEFGDERLYMYQIYYQNISPVKQIKQLNVPVYIIHGKNDPRVPVADVINLINLLDHKEKAYWYFLALNEGHDFNSYNVFQYRISSVIQFVKTYLLDQ